MKVKELIRQLESYDPEARVYTSSYMGEGTDEVLACIAYVHNGDVIIENENQFDVENEIQEMLEQMDMFILNFMIVNGCGVKRNL